MLDWHNVNREILQLFNKFFQPYRIFFCGQYNFLICSYFFKLLFDVFQVVAVKDMMVGVSKHIITAGAFCQVCFNRLHFFVGGFLRDMPSNEMSYLQSLNRAAFLITHLYAP